MRTNNYLIAMLLLALPVYVQGQEQESPQGKCLLAEKLYKDFDELTPINVSDERFEIISKIRPCVKTYPWPKGKFLADTETQSAVTSIEMEAILDKINKVIENYDSTEKVELNETQALLMELRILSGDYDQDEVIKYRLSQGMDVELLKLFGYFVYLHLLNSEGKYDIALLKSEEYIKTYEITPEETIFDQLEEATYFSKQALFNLILLNKYKAIAGQNNGTLKDQLKYLHEYSNMRNTLRVQAQNFGDPFKDLFSNAGCNLYGR